MRVLVSGASGMIGTALCRVLEDDGHSVVRLVRREPRGAGEVRWDPANGILEAQAMDGVDAVVNLAGASIGRLPWTAGYKKQIVDSRVQTTRTLATAMKAAAQPPTVFVNASAVGYYGDRPGEVLDEQSAKGSGFLAELVGRWEAEAHRAPGATRVVTLRTGFVVGPAGAMKPILALAKAGFGGSLGSGRQYWPWISLRDEVAAIRHLLDSELRGAVNLAGPTPATAGTLLRSVARQLHRPYWVPAPAWALQLLLRDAARELLLSDQRVSAQRLLRDGFVFRDATVDQAVGRLVRARRAG